MNELFDNIKNGIINGQFKNKGELQAFLEELKKNPQHKDTITSELEAELLHLFDEKSNVMHIEESPLVQTENIIAETAQAQHDFIQATKNGIDALAKAAAGVSKTDESQLVPLNDILNYDGIPAGILSIVRNFITKDGIDPNNYLVDIKTGQIHNTETNHILEENKNEMGNTSEDIGPKPNGSVGHEEVDTMGQGTTTHEKEDTKIRRLVPTPPTNRPNSNAFIQSSLLFIICVVISLIMATIILM